MSFYFSLPSINNGSLEDVENKDWVFHNIKNYMYLRLEKMFKYKRLPDSIPPNIFNYMLMNGGFSVLTDKAKKDTILAFQGGLGGEPDEYYRPTICIVSNPALSFSEELKIGEDCALIRNDAFCIGLDPLLTRYAGLMAENIITMKTADILLRVIALLSAPDDKTKASAEIYLEKLKNGELAVISENRFFDGIELKSPPSNNGAYLTQFIELHQYYKGSLFNELGLQANFNMKRESIGKGEASLSEDILMPLCESMLETRRQDFKVFNEMYNENVEVDFDSAWLMNKKEQYYELEAMKMESESSQLGKEADESENSDDIREGIEETKGNSSESGKSINDIGEQSIESENDEKNIEFGEEDNSNESKAISDEQANGKDINKDIDEASIEVNVEINNQTIEEIDEDEDENQNKSDINTNE